MVRLTGERPIGPVGNDPSSVEGMPIHECGEPLVEIRPGARIHVAPMYHERGVAAAPTVICVRRRVLDALRGAAAGLPPGIDILVWDGLRPLETQAGIVEAFKMSLPEEGRDEVIERYLSPPPESEQAFLRSPPPHATGGAVDVTLCDASGTALHLGAEFDQFDETAWLAYYEDPDHCADGDAVHWRERRRMLYWAMLGAGFAPYPWEYWHYEIGTMVAAVFYDRSCAEYGAAVTWSPAP